MVHTKELLKHTVGRVKATMVKTEVAPVIEEAIANSTCPRLFQGPNKNFIRIIDTGNVYGFALVSI